MTKQAVHKLVPSLKSCRRLAEYGVELDTYFGWFQRPDGEWSVRIKGYEEWEGNELVPAPTASTLLEVLPNSFNHKKQGNYFDLSITKVDTERYSVEYNSPVWLNRAHSFGDTPAQAIINLLLSLLEEEVIGVEDLEV